MLIEEMLKEFFFSNKCKGNEYQEIASAWEND